MFKINKLPTLISKETNIMPSLVLQIDGVSTLFGIGKIKKYIRIGDENLFVGNDWAIGGFNEIEDQADVINLDGTSTSISQQMLQDKGGTTSVSSIKISLIDYNESITKIISDNILGRRAYVYLGFQETAFPYDYILIFSGIVDDIEAGANIVINVAHPEQKKRQELFQQIKTETTAFVSAASNVIPFKNYTGQIILDMAYLKINEEVCKINSISGNNFIVTRAQFDTIAQDYDAKESIEIMYKLQGNAIDLALKLMLSGGDEYYIYNQPITSFVSPNKIYFHGIDAAQKYGFVIGDFITITGAYFGNNNCNKNTIANFYTDDNGSFIEINNILFTNEQTTEAVASFKSQYNVLSTGVGLGGDEVDVAEFKKIKQYYTSFIPSYDFMIKDTINAKEFIDTQILFPFGGYSLPRKGKISMGITSPPLALDKIPKLDMSNVLNPDKIRARRSIGKYFYNNVVYKYNPDIIEDKMLSGYVTVDSDSINKIKVGQKSLLIESEGLRDSSDTQRLMRIASRRLLDRYRFAAESFNVSCFYGDGFTIECGDIVLFGDINLPDSKNAKRSFEPRLFEVINKKLDIKTGQIDLEFIDTNYLVDGRFGIISPSSKIISATINTLKIIDSYAFEKPEIEKDKWANYINHKIIVHNKDYSIVYETILRGFDASDNYRMLVDNMAGIPTNNFIVDLAPYTENETVQNVAKQAHCFFCPSIPVVSISGNTITVNANDISKITIDCVILLRTENWTVSEETKVVSITGNTFTVDKTVAGNIIELVGFKDKGSAYRYI